MARTKAFVNLFDLFDFDVLKSVMGQFLLADVGQPQLALKRPILPRRQPERISQPSLRGECRHKGNTLFPQ
jgi:hypothetical protein